MRVYRRMIRPALTDCIKKSMKVWNVTLCYAVKSANCFAALACRLDTFRISDSIDLAVTLSTRLSDRNH